MTAPRAGIDVPDHRGRIGLDRAGRGLDRNPDVRVTDVELLAAGWHVMRRTTLQVRGPSGKVRLSANPAEPGYPCYVSVLGDLAWMPPRGELRPF